MATAVKDYVGSVTWASSYLQCFSRCGRRWFRRSPRCAARQDALAAAGAGDDSEKDDEREEQLLMITMKVSAQLQADNNFARERVGHRA